MIEKKTFNCIGVALICFMNMCQIAQASDKSNGSPAIREVTDIGYFEGAGKGSAKHQLDLFIPANQENARIFFFVHGGAWV